jgi:hypothetical protein
MTPELRRRAMLTAGAGLAVGGVGLSSAWAGQPPRDGDARNLEERVLSISEFGVLGNGVTDDGPALQAALDAMIGQGYGPLHLPPGDYVIKRPLKLDLDHARVGDISRPIGIKASGARLLSRISTGKPVLEIVSRTTCSYLQIDGLGIVGGGKEGHGLALACDAPDNYLYNASLRDVVVEGCGGDGCRIVGNVFESQMFNCYFRDNRGNGATFAHGSRGGILSAIHVFGCVFGQNGGHGAALLNGCYDVAFHGCYLLLNGQNGLLAENGCTLLSNCGFENNHAGADSFAQGAAAIALSGFATLVGCGAYSMFHQTHLIRADVHGQLVMIGCRGFGDGQAKSAGLARLSGSRAGIATLLGCNGAVESLGDFRAVEISGDGAPGLSFGSRWDSPNLARLGDYRLWIDKSGKLRMKKGDPLSDDDGNKVGAV